MHKEGGWEGRGVVQRLPQPAGDVDGQAGEWQGVGQLLKGVGRGEVRRGRQGGREAGVGTVTKEPPEEMPRADRGRFSNP